jgi:hypothetical protein
MIPLFSAGGLEPPLYMHTTISNGSSGGSSAYAAMTPEREWQQRVQALFRTTVSQSALGTCCLHHLTPAVCIT